MTLGPRELVVLDTSVLIHLGRNNRTGREIERRFNLASRPEKPLISSVTRGESMALARYWNWGVQRLSRLEDLLDQFVTVDAGSPPVIREYAELHATSIGTGNQIQHNDLWIAATCVAARAQLITNDTDFDWLHPAHITRHYVAPVR